jgi:diphthine synthase
MLGMEAVRNANAVYFDCYTSRLIGTTIEELAGALGVKISMAGREELEQDARTGLLTVAENENVVLLVGGDPMVSTTHVDLVLKAREMGIETHIVHGASIQTAVCGLTGLQNYRFGRSATVAYPYGANISATPVDVIRANLSIDAHTLLYLDLDDELGPMTIPGAAELLLQAADNCGWHEFREFWAAGIARAGSPAPVVAVRRIAELGAIEWGGALHVLAVPAPLHIVEFEALRELAGAPEELEGYSR